MGARRRGRRVQRYLLRAVENRLVSLEYRVVQRGSGVILRLRPRKLLNRQKHGVRENATKAHVTRSLRVSTAGDRHGLVALPACPVEVRDRAGVATWPQTRICPQAPRWRHERRNTMHARCHDLCDVIVPKQRAPVKPPPLVHEAITIVLTAFLVSVVILNGNAVPCVIEHEIIARLALPPNGSNRAGHIGHRRLFVEEGLHRADPALVREGKHVLAVERTREGVLRAPIIERADHHVY
mmetsp:Transcript_117219/g.331696  ORF Transcript_117219/g.331696 Transcript_117219/m.331696 type:complete len:239 (+) Transcript_117219:384-1100(+)